MGDLQMRQVGEDRYESADGWVMQREEGKTPNGNEYNGAWVLRDQDGNYVGHDKYRYDMEARHHLNLRSRQTEDEWQTESHDGFKGKSRIP